MNQFWHLTGQPSSSTPEPTVISNRHNQTLVGLPPTEPIQSRVTAQARFDAYAVTAFNDDIRTTIHGNDQSKDVVVDLSAVDFFDSRALVAVLQAQQAIHARGGRCYIPPVSRAVQAMLDYTGTADRLTHAA